MSEDIFDNTLCRTDLTIWVTIINGTYVWKYLDTIHYENICIILQQ